MIWRLICVIVGHRLYGSDGIAGAHECVRCGFRIPAVVWPRGHVPPKYPSGLQSPTRPEPAMPACKLPAESASNADLMHEIKALREEIRQMRRRDGGSVLHPSRPIPHIPQPTDGR